MKKKTKINIFWFRRDLRIVDNHGLYWALNSSYPVLPIFIFDKNILDKLNADDSRVTFIHKSLSLIQEDLKKANSDLMTLHDTPEKAWKYLLDNYDINEVFANEDYEPYGIERDLKVQDILKTQKIDFNLYKDHCIFSKKDILKKDGTPYTVYTPYKNKWKETLTPKNLASYKSEKYKDNFCNNIQGNLISLKDLGFTLSKIDFPPRIMKKKKIESYDKNRDIPSIDGTSLLGIHLRFGTVSIRKATALAYETNETWLSELIWREFFSQILYNFPHVEKSPFREKYEKIEWLNNPKELQRWKEGKTGFPLVDAGIRELNQTGHMHNRVRMLVASFLIKDLLIDWRLGERYFAEKLLDYDLASNNGNWQWAAGTGCDAAPYFRIFNPTTQLKKFDPDLSYVKKWVPEYGTDKYVEPMVDHKEAYHRAIYTYNKAVK